MVGYSLLGRSSGWVIPSVMIPGWVILSLVDTSGWVILSLVDTSGWVFLS